MTGVQTCALPILVSSGATLKANNLKAVEKIADISARLIVNQAALKTKRDALMPIIESLQNRLTQGRNRTLSDFAPSDVNDIIAVNP